MYKLNMHEKACAEMRSNVKINFHMKKLVQE